MNIKDIINNEQIFLDFDKAYKKLGKLKNEKFQYNYSSYTEFNQIIPGLIKNMINEINEKILYNLNQIVNDQRFENILTQINMISVKNIEKSEIDKKIKSHIKNNYDDFTQKRLTMNQIYDNYENKFNEQFQIINTNNKQGKKTVGQDNIISVHLNNVSNPELKNKNYDANILNIGRKIFNIIYNPYEKVIEIKTQNDILNTSYIIKDAFNHKLYDIKNDYESGKTVINYFYKDAKEKLNLESYKLIIQIELEILKLVEEINGYDEKVKLFSIKKIIQKTFSFKKYNSRFRNKKTKILSFNKRIFANRIWN